MDTTRQEGFVVESVKEVTNFVFSLCMGSTSDNGDPDNNEYYHHKHQDKDNEEDEEGDSKKGGSENTENPFDCERHEGDREEGNDGDEHDPEIFAADGFR